MNNEGIFFSFYILILSSKPCLCHKAFKQPLNNLLNISNLLYFIIQIIILSTVKHTDRRVFCQTQRYQVARMKCRFYILQTAAVNYSKYCKLVIEVKLVPSAHPQRSKQESYIIIFAKKVGIFLLAP